MNEEEMHNEDEEEEECEDDEEDQDEDWWDKAESEEDWGSTELDQPIQTPVNKKRRAPVTNVPISTTPQPRGSALETFALAIQQHEGWFPPGGSYPKGSASFRNSNPGNLKYVGQREATGKDERGFAIFPDYSAGLRALQFDIGLKLGRNPDWNFEDFFSVYAPSTDNNDPFQYARVVAKKLGVNSKTRIKDVV